MAKSRVGQRFGLERGRAIFDAELERLYKQARTSLYRYVINAHPLVALTAPLIYTLIVPLVLLDVCVTLYQASVFPPTVWQRCGAPITWCSTATICLI